MAFYVTMATFWMTLLTNKFYKYCHGWCMSSSIGHKTYLLLSAICDERSSWVFEIWMKKHTVCDTNCNIVKSIMPSKNYKEWQIMLGLHLVLVTLHRGGSWWVLSKTTRIGDTTNHIFSVLLKLTKLSKLGQYKIHVLGAGNVHRHHMGLLVREQQS